jgi:hypothetical protein
LFNLFLIFVLCHVFQLGVLKEGCDYLNILHKILSTYERKMVQTDWFLMLEVGLIQHPLYGIEAPPTLCSFWSKATINRRK